MSEKLPSSIVSLVHHTKLNERGWWEKTICNLIVGVIATNKNLPCTKEDILNMLKEYILDIDFARFEKQFNTLLTNKSIIEVQSEIFILSDILFEEFKKLYDEQEKIENSVKKIFVQLLSISCPNLVGNDIWKDFNQDLLIPLVKDLGAKTYDFLNVGRKKIYEYQQFNSFLKKYDVEKDKLSNVIIDFFKTDDKEIRSYILRYLNAYFFVEASNLSKDIIKEIYNYSELNAQFDIYIDSNFLFSLLDLHENTFNEATKSLIEVIKIAKNKVKISFHILPTTLEEVRGVVLANKYALKNERITQSNLIERAIDILPYGFKKKYYEKCKLANQNLDIEQYFEPYDRNLLITLKSKQIFVDTNDYKDFLENFSSPKYLKINDDTLTERDRRVKRMKEQGKGDTEIDSGKLYDKILHDMRLWHIVSSKRSIAHTPRSIKSWIITLDSKLSAFDWARQRSKSDDLPICLQPNELITMLQFWIPRNEKLEFAIFENFKIPLMYQDYDVETEKISMSILSALALHENSEDLDKETIIEIETSNIIRSKIKPDTTTQEIAEMISEFDKIKSQELKEINQLLENEKIEIQQKSEQKEKELQQKSEQQTKALLDKIEQSKEREKQLIETLNQEKEKGLSEKIVVIETNITEKIAFLSSLQEQKNICEQRIKKESDKWYNVFRNPEKIKQEILNEYPMLKQFEEVSNETEKLKEKLKLLKFPKQVACENTNAKYYNLLEIQGFHFAPKQNSYDVFFHAQQSKDYFSLRDKDYITLDEIKKIRQKYPNHYILHLYCFENYLYHPDNLQEVIGSKFDKQNYINEILSQIKTKKTKIIVSLEETRKGYSELKDVGKQKDGELHIADCLESNQFDKSYPFFSAKDDLDKSFIEKQLPSTIELVKSNWFRNAVTNILTK